MLLILLSHLENWDDTWVIETGCRLRFDEETLDILLAGKLSGTNHLDGDDAVQPDLSCLVDDPHATAGDLLDEFVLAEVSIGKLGSPLVLPSRLLSILAPFLQVVGAQILGIGDVRLLGDGQQGVVHEVEPVDIAAEDVAGPGATAQCVRRRQTGVPAAAVGVGVGHVADHPADVGAQGQLNPAVVVFPVPGPPTITVRRCSAAVATARS